MRNKSLFLIMACVCGTIAAIGVSQWMHANSSTTTQLATVEIFVTTQTIDIGEQITPEMVRLEQWPADRVPRGSSGKLDELQGKYARQRFYEGEPVLPVKLMDDANGTSQTIPNGYSVVSMKADQESSVASLLRPGDRVDVMAYFTKGDLIPESMAKTVLTGVRVFAVDGRTERANEEDSDVQNAKTVSLLVHKKDVPAWTYASELGRIRLTLGNPGDVNERNSGTDENGSGQEFLRWLGDHQAAQAAREADRNNQTPMQQFMAAQPPAPPAPVAPEPPKGFKMLKMSNGVLTEYFIEEGSRVPVIIGELGGKTEPGSTSSASRLTSASPIAQSQAPADYSYLNGSQSPFFQPPPGGIRSPGDTMDLQPTPESTTTE